MNVYLLDICGCLLLHQELHSDVVRGLCPERHLHDSSRPSGQWLFCYHEQESKQEHSKSLGNSFPGYNKASMIIYTDTFMRHMHSLSPPPPLLYLSPSVFLLFSAHIHLTGIHNTMNAIHPLLEVIHFRAQTTLTQTIFPYYGNKK